MTASEHASEHLHTVKKNVSEIAGATVKAISFSAFLKSLKLGLKNTDEVSSNKVDESVQSWC